MTSQRDLLEVCGAALYGNSWQRGQLATLLNASPRTVRRWYAEQDKVPVGIWLDLKEAMDARLMVLQTAQDALKPLTVAKD